MGNAGTDKKKVVENTIANAKYFDRVYYIITWMGHYSVRNTPPKHPYGFSPYTIVYPDGTVVNQDEELPY